MKRTMKTFCMAVLAMFACITFASAQKKVEVLSSGKTWGEFYPKENKFVRIKDGQVQYTRTLLSNGDIMTEENERWGRTDEQGQMYCAKNKRKVKYDPETMWVYDNGKVVGKLIAAKTQDGKDILSYTRFGFNFGDGVVGTEKELKGMDHRLLIWLFYCFLKPEEGKVDAEEVEYHQKALDAQKKRDQGHTAENRFAANVEKMIEAAVEKDNGLEHNGVKGRLLDVEPAGGDWNLVKDKDQLGRDIVVARNTYAWVTVRFDKYYFFRKYLVSQDYKAGDPLKDEAYGPVFLRRMPVEDMNPVYE